MSVDITGVAPASPADADVVRESLIRHGHIVPTSALGTFGRGATFEDVLARVDAYLLRAVGDASLESVMFPPVLDRSILERTGYLDAHPDMCGAVHAFSGSERDARAIPERIARGEAWGDLLQQTDVALAPAACYPLYPTCAGTLPLGGRHVTLMGWAYRHEPSNEPTRMRAFRVRELVRLGTPEDVTAWRDDWMQRGVELLRALGLPAELQIASDPFFGRAGKMLAAGQIEQRLKFEVVVPVISNEKPTACCSFNYHLDKFGFVFGIHSADGAVAHSGCLGYGMERVTMALFRMHGYDVAEWPDDVRAHLWT